MKPPINLEHFKSVPPTNIELFEAFKQTVVREDPLVLDAVQEKTAAEAVEILCTRYGMPFDVIWALNTPEILNLLGHALTLFNRGKGLALLDTYITRRIMPCGDVPEDLVGARVHLLSANADMSWAFCQIVAEGKYKGGFCFLMGAALTERRIRRVDMND